MDYKNIIKPQYLNDLLYIFSGALANAWLSTEFLFYGNKILFLDNYLIEDNTFLYIMLYLSFSFVVGVFLREVGEFVYKFFTWILKKLNLKLTQYDTETIPFTLKAETEDRKYMISRRIARINAHLIFTGFFFSTIFFVLIFKNKNYLFICIIIILLINSIRNVSELLED